MNEASFWIRVFDLPSMAWNEYVGNLVGQALGRVEEVDIDYEMLNGENICIFVYALTSQSLYCEKRR